MRRLFAFITLVIVLPFASVNAQQGFSFGLGAGPNLYWGSVNEADNTSYSISIDTRYNFNSQLSTTLSYTFSNLQAARYKNSVKTLYFQTAASSIDLHIGADLVSIIQHTQEDNNFKVLMDFGLGYTFYNPEAYYYDLSSGNYIPDNTHSATPHTQGSDFKFHIGGEISYKFTDNLAVYYSSLGHLVFSSDIDGYSRYLKDHDNDSSTPKEFVETLNDFYYTGIIGVRYDLDGFSGGGGNRSKPHKTARPSKSKSVKAAGGRFLNWNHGSIFQNFRFDRFAGKKSASSSVKSNKNRSIRLFPGGRWQGRKSAQTTVPKKKTTNRYQGQKKDGNIPKQK